MTPAGQPMRGDHDQIGSLRRSKPGSFLGGVAGSDDMACFELRRELVLRDDEAVFGGGPFPLLVAFRSVEDIRRVGGYRVSRWDHMHEHELGLKMPGEFGRIVER